MRLRLVVRRAAAPDSRLLWNVPDQVDYPVSQLTAQVHTVLPLYSEADPSSTLEDFVVELIDKNGGSFECLHFQQITDVLKEDDQVLIRPLRQDELYAREITGRMYFEDGRPTVVDGVSYGALQSISMYPALDEGSHPHPRASKRRRTSYLNASEVETSTPARLMAPTRPRSSTSSNHPSSLSRPSHAVGKNQQQFVSENIQINPHFQSPSHPANLHNQVMKKGPKIMCRPPSPPQAKQSVVRSATKVTSSVLSRSPSSTVALKKPYKSTKHVDALIPFETQQNEIQEASVLSDSDGPPEEVSSKAPPSPLRARQIEKVSADTFDVQTERQGLSSKGTASSHSKKSQGRSPRPRSLTENKANSKSKDGDEDKDSSDSSSDESSSSGNSSDASDEPVAKPVKNKATPVTRSKIAVSLSSDSDSSSSDCSSDSSLDSSSDSSDSDSSDSDSNSDSSGADEAIRRKSALSKCNREPTKAAHATVASTTASACQAPTSDALISRPGKTKTQKRNERRRLFLKARRQGQAQTVVKEKDNTADELEKRRQALLRSLSGYEDLVPETEPWSQPSPEALSQKSQPSLEPKSQTQDVPQKKSSDTRDYDSWRGKINLRAVECVRENMDLGEPPFPFVQRWYRTQNASHGKRKRRDWDEQATEDQLPYDDADVEESYYANSSTAHYYNESQNYHGYNDDMLDSATQLPPPQDDIPEPPEDLSTLPKLQPGQAKKDMIITYQKWILSAATNWEPVVANVAAIILKVHEDDSLVLRLSYRDRQKEHPEKEYDQATGQRIYRGFEAPDDEDDESNDSETLTFAELIQPLILVDPDAHADKDQVDVDGTFHEAVLKTQLCEQTLLAQNVDDDQKSDTRKSCSSAEVGAEAEQNVSYEPTFLSPPPTSASKGLTDSQSHLEPKPTQDTRQTMVADFSSQVEINSKVDKTSSLKRSPHRKSSHDHPDTQKAGQYTDHRVLSDRDAIATGPISVTPVVGSPGRQSSEGDMEASPEQATIYDEAQEDVVHSADLSEDSDGHIPDRQNPH
ncbi:hypothetical protein CFIMG_003552RA [Ceratocystis fimbriata CBS 114723]|uniref:DUF7357 domain-containing protein n=1 Tax=Ceratocystis fimbriata CBS 114723 TaxID=1035309 RepID=A0A2C5WU86_9PEZI|nr:hypothetical protein CFIMG_003552RA [Ceratocystis fimbriata CBS 114723]